MKPGEGFDLDNPNEAVKQDGPVECLGLTFANDAERRAHYLTLLAEKLKDPEFRKIEGFPIGEDEDILELSDPPYYTACPNPFIEEFMVQYGRPYDPAEKYKREPYAADVSEGKNDPIYNVHSYHTKVPHKAIMRYILHYTNPGDVVFDGFCGTGMTGVAGALCAELGSSRTVSVGSISNAEAGGRSVIVSDLSPIATFISGNLLAPANAQDLLKHCEEITKYIYDGYGHLYETNHNGWKVRERKSVVHQKYDYHTSDKGRVEFTVFSDVIACPECGVQTTFYDVAVDDAEDKLIKSPVCNSCGATVPEKKWEQVNTSEFDEVLGEVVNKLKIQPVVVNYTYGGSRFEKLVDEDDFENYEMSKNLLSKISLPKVRLIPGKETQRNSSKGVDYIHQFFTDREHLFVALLLNEIKKIADIRVRNKLLMALTASMPYASRMRRFRADRKGGGPLSGTLYMGSLITPPNVLETYKRNLKSIAEALHPPISRDRKQLVSTQSACEIPNIRDSSIDYIFTDPPFGHNFDYSELNFFWESILRVVTSQDSEAIVSTFQNKGVEEYKGLMERAFHEYYRVLKPGHWITVEFSNSKASVWNAIQSAMEGSGFIVANVTGLDKKQLSYKAVMTPTAVKQDLVISAYKPNGGFEGRFENETDEEGVWDFIRTHLGYLPVVKKQQGELVRVSERDPRLLFDQMVSYFVRNVRDIPVSSKEFQQGLLERFAERDGMIFLPEQIVQYDRARISSKQLKQLSIFVDDEASAIEWIRQLLNEKPQSYQDIHPKFISELSGWKKAEEQLELSKLLEQSFLNYDGAGPLPPQIHSYLSTNFKEMRNLVKDDARLIKKAKDRWYVPNPDREEDLQKLRDRDLLKQFSEYKNHEGRKLKTVRLEAVRCGFKKAWQERDYSTIITVAEKIPQNLLQEDQKLLMWYDQAQTRNSDESLF
ncbi:MAG: hypothetical protein COB61_009830 [Thiotrichales bacterium]|nr:hypothetical protein [Thiotrichales bacterium]